MVVGEWYLVQGGGCGEKRWLGVWLRPTAKKERDIGER